MTIPVTSKLFTTPAAKIARFASQPVNTMANQAKDVIDIAAKQTNEAVKKPSLLSKVLYPFTKIGQGVIGLFKAIAGFIGNVGNGIKAGLGHFFKKPAVTPKMVQEIPQKPTVTPLNPSPLPEEAIEVVNA